MPAISNNNSQEQLLGVQDLATIPAPSLNDAAAERRAVRFPLLLERGKGRSEESKKTASMTVTLGNRR
jgi:hypothetical protein